MIRRMIILGLKIFPNLTDTVSKSWTIFTFMSKQELKYLFAFLDYWKALKIKDRKRSARPHLGTFIRSDENIMNPKSE